MRFLPLPEPTKDIKFLGILAASDDHDIQVALYEVNEDNICFEVILGAENLSFSMTVLKPTPENGTTKKAATNYLFNCMNEYMIKESWIDEVLEVAVDNYLSDWKE
jgi:hypothetical protein